MDIRAEFTPTDLHRPKTVTYVLLQKVDGRFDSRRGQVAGISGDLGSTTSSQQRRNRLVKSFAKNVPERDVYPADDIYE